MEGNVSRDEEVAWTTQLFWLVEMNGERGRMGGSCYESLVESLTRYMLLCSCMSLE